MRSRNFKTGWEPFYTFICPVKWGPMFVILLAAMLAAMPCVDASEKKPKGASPLDLNEKWTGDFDGMAKDRVIRVLVAHSKTFYFLDGGHQRGISYDILKEFEKYVNKKLKTKTLKIHVVFYAVPRDQLIQRLVEGWGDLAVANLTITPQRLKHVDFSNPMLTGVKELVVTGPAAPPVNRIEDLAGQSIHVRKSSSYYESLVKLNASFKKSGRPKMRLIAANEVFEDEDLLEMVNAGLIPMIVMDSHKAKFWEQIFDKIKVHDNIVVREGGQIAWAFRKNSPKLKGIVNEFVKGHKAGTLIGNMVLKRYLKNTKYIKNALEKNEIKKFDSMVKFFMKYGGKYDFDHLMITALAYQESGLDQRKRSRVGAVGVMQILPSTAADPNVNIRDIHKLEQNIHAGTKYLRFLIEQYYKNEPMTEENKMLFAFASYNAGPGRIKGIRKKAAAMGLDPNIWFYNVEIAAAREIGRETVQYVGNIYKYYTAYRVIFSHRERKKRLRLDYIGAGQR
jgi:membrane-bound lytic murein transglycosylase MltF